MYYIIYRIAKADDGKPKWGVYMNCPDGPYITRDHGVARDKAQKLRDFMYGCGYDVSAIVAKAD